MFRAGIAWSARPLRSHLRPVLRAGFPSAVPASALVTPLNVHRFNSTPAAGASEIKTLLPSFADAEAVSRVSDLTSDQLGYLDSIGLAQGWGPTAAVERLLEFSHVYTGLPWWGSIICATVLVRVVMFPLYMKSSTNAAKMTKVKPQLDQVMRELKLAENQQEQVEAAHKRKKLLKDNDIHMLHSIFPMLQLPLAYGFFQALRKMAAYPVGGFSTQGTAWFEDLTQVDPYLGLQVMAAAVVISMSRMGGETGAQAMNPMMKKVMLYVPILSIFITKEFSAAVVLYFAVNAALSFLQTLTLRNKYFRKLTKMPAIEPAPVVPGAPKPPATVSEWWRDFNKNINDSTQKKMKQTDAKLGAMASRRENPGFIKRH